jgi:hypothetical protein
LDPFSLSSLPEGGDFGFGAAQCAGFSITHLSHFVGFQLVPWRLDRQQILQVTILLHLALPKVAEQKKSRKD